MNWISISSMFHLNVYKTRPGNSLEIIFHHLTTIGSLKIFLHGRHTIAGYNIKAMLFFFGLKTVEKTLGTLLKWKLMKKFKIIYQVRI